MIPRVYVSISQIGIIGGTGLSDPDILQERQEKVVSTPYGEVRSPNFKRQMISCGDTSNDLFKS